MQNPVVKMVKGEIIARIYESGETFLKRDGRTFGYIPYPNIEEAIDDSEDNGYEMFEDNR